MERRTFVKTLAVVGAALLAPFKAFGNRSYVARAGEMGEGAPPGVYRVVQHPRHADMEIVTLPDGRQTYRVKGYPLPAYLFEGDGEGVLRADGSRFYRTKGKGGWVSPPGLTLRDVLARQREDL